MSSRSRSPCSCSISRCPRSRPQTGGIGGSSNGRCTWPISSASLRSGGGVRARDDHGLRQARGLRPARLNLLLLFFVSVLPFPTKMIGEFAHHVDAERWAVTVTASTCSRSGDGKHRGGYGVAEGPLSGEHPEDHVREVTKKLSPSLGFNTAAIVIGLLAPRVGIFLSFVIAFYLLIPFRAIASISVGGSTGRGRSEKLTRRPAASATGSVPTTSRRPSTMHLFAAPRAAWPRDDRLGEVGSVDDLAGALTVTFRRRAMSARRSVRGSLSAMRECCRAAPVTLSERHAHPSVRGCDRSPDGTSTSPEADPPVVDVSDHGVTIIRPHRRSKR